MDIEGFVDKCGQGMATGGVCVTLRQSGLLFWIPASKTYLPKLDVQNHAHPRTRKSMDPNQVFVCLFGVIIFVCLFVYFVPTCVGAD